jgi:hypothetical protein
LTNSYIFSCTIYCCSKYRTTRTSRSVRRTRVTANYNGAIDFCDIEQRAGTKVYGNWSGWSVNISAGGINKIDLSWDKGLARVGGEETKSINTFVAINSNSIIKSYDIGNITILLTNDGSKEEVLAAINSIFTNFAGFVTAIGKPNSVFHNGKYGTFNE